jgi:two-component system sensor histidine kinase BaeS
MSLRVRALALIMFVAIAASGATAWLTLRQATREVRASAAAGREDVERITDGLRAYGLAHGTWSGVVPTVRDLAAATGQRLRVLTDDGTLVADSDLLVGRPARAVGAAPFVLDPRPVLTLPDVADPVLLVRRTLFAVNRYRSGIRYASCLTRAGLSVTAAAGEDGVPTYTTSAPAPPSCKPVIADTEVRGETADANACLRVQASVLRDCLGATFARQAAAIGPPRLDVYVGAVDEVPAPFAVGPAIAAALGVAAAAVVVALLLSLRVLRPVRALTGAAAAVGAGDLARRVPAKGRDEIAELGRSFNLMADSLQASEERQQRLVADVAHELRTPLANLRGYLEAVRDGVVEPTPALVASLHEEVLLQQRTVEDLQDLALAEAGALTYHCGPLDLGDIADAAVTAHRATAEAAGVALRVERSPAPVVGDADRLRQLVGNLVTNAVSATPSSGNVTVRARADGASASVEVSDTGTGIAPADLPHVFERLWRADAARRRSTGGSGLGLAIARRIAEDHGGTIRVASTTGEGSTFTVLLPRGGPAAE